MTTSTSVIHDCVCFANSRTQAVFAIGLLQRECISLIQTVPCSTLKVLCIVAVDLLYDKRIITAAETQYTEHSMGYVRPQEVCTTIDVASSMICLL